MAEINWSLITAESLADTSIIKLRELGKKIGVKSPTTYSKSDLIAKIIEKKERVMVELAEEAKTSQPEDLPQQPETQPQPEVKPREQPETQKPQTEEGNKTSRHYEKGTPTRLNGGNKNGNFNRNGQGKEGYTRSKTFYDSTSTGAYSAGGDKVNNAPLKPMNPQKKEEENAEQKNSVTNNNGKQNQRRFNQEEEISLEQCELRSGILEILPDGYGFLRASNFRNSPKDSYIANIKIRRMGLKAGDYITAYCKPSSAEGKPPAVVSVQSVNGKPLEYLEHRKDFDKLVPIFPQERLRLELQGQRNELAVRAIDLIAPIGKGQRAMVVSPPKAGKTTLLKMIANSISINHPECKLMVLLIDERPEEVTDMQRSTKGEVIYSTFDEESDNHIKVAELVLARAKRMVEDGEDVVILLDSLTRMARASNVIVPSSGKTLSGGVDPVALYMPKRFFGAARNIENGGSLTIIATALVDTGSRMDDIVYEEFKGTGNMEIHLDRRLSEKRIFPAIDLLRSGTRREELLLTQKELEGVFTMRRLLSSGDNQEAAESIISLMQKTVNNEELIVQLNLQLAKLLKGGFRI